MNHTSAVLLAKDISVQFTTEKGYVQAVKHISIEVHQGIITALIGQSGSGKSATAMAIAGILKDIFAADGIVGRLGGDEFAVFLPGTHTQDALTARLEQVLEQVKSVKQCNKAPSNVTCSIGVTFCDDKRSIEEIYKNADDALYRAKQNGKNQITFF